MRVRTATAVLLVWAAAALAWAGVAPDLKESPACNVCGMSRERFAHSRVLIRWKDGHAAAVCSLSCAAVELSRKPAGTARAVLVADHDTKELIEADKAVWVIGGNEPGVMTNVPKWAFGNRPAAEAFVKRLGGRRATYEEALKLATEDVGRRQEKKH